MLLSVAELLPRWHGADHAASRRRKRTSQAVGLWFAAAAVGNARRVPSVSVGPLAESPLLRAAGPGIAGAAVALCIRLSPLERLINASRTNPEGGRR